MSSPKKIRPPKALLNDTQKLCAQHGWQGFALAAPVALPAASIASLCPPGTRPHDITYQDASGRWITRTVCL
jgi:hypothetical protein